MRFVVALVALGSGVGCGFSAPASHGSGDGGVIDGSRSDALDALDGPSPPPIDAPPGIACYGSSFGMVCLSSAPTGTTAVNALTIVDTDSPSTCAQAAAGTTITNACVIAADTFVINARVTATGSRSLVLVAANAITINMNGVIDVSSRGPARGAGALASCTGTSPPGSGGGGSGGSFAAAGGDGGSGTSGAGGGASPATLLSALHGGCPGQTGDSGGAGGWGGGAVDLIASAITINGRIEANGRGGGGAGAGDHGGGGGGSGGAIVLDTMNLTFNASARLMAQGGGGGGGSSNNAGGGPGGDPVMFGQQAMAGFGGGNGGPGGTGGAGSAGTPGTPGTGNSGGGAGGGGAGFVRALDPAFTQGGMAVPNFN